MADLDTSTTAHPPHAHRNLQGKVALVTGAASGLGAALAIRHALLLPRESVIAELTVLPVHETSWP